MHMAGEKRKENSRLRTSGFDCSYRDDRTKIPQLP